MIWVFYLSIAMGVVCFVMLLAISSKSQEIKVNRKWLEDSIEFANGCNVNNEWKIKEEA